MPLSFPLQVQVPGTSIGSMLNCDDFARRRQAHAVATHWSSSWIIERSSSVGSVFASVLGCDPVLLDCDSPSSPGARSCRSTSSHSYRRKRPRERDGARFRTTHEGSTSSSRATSIRFSGRLVSRLASASAVRRVVRRVYERVRPRRRRRRACSFTRIQ